METNFISMPAARPGRHDRVPDLEVGRLWEEAPSAVVLAYGIALASTALYSLAAGGTIGDIILRDRDVRDVSVQHFLLLGLSAILALVNLWLVSALKKGRPVAWQVQKVVSLASLILLPLGTALHLLLLFRWSRFESKAWFIVR